MNIVIQLSHPAHFHLFKNVYVNLEKAGHQVFVLIKTKDILEELMQKSGIPYHNILPIAHRKSRMGILWDMFVRDERIYRFSKKHKIQLLTGSTPEVTHVGKVLRCYSVSVGEDDAAVIPAFHKVAGPFVQCFVTPTTCDNGKLNNKSVKYAGYQELAYLHPHHFTPNREVVEKYFSTDEPYFIIRFAKLNAHHDAGIRGITDEIARKIIALLKPHGRVYITSERELIPEFEPYRIAINPLDIHHVMAFAELYIGDSQTMAAESGVLGVPFIRYNDFVGRIGYLKELEDNYHLGYGVKPSDPDKLFNTIEELMAMPNRVETFQERRKKMLSEKIDYAQFLTWFLGNYPESKTIMQRDPDYQYRFK